VGEILDAPEHFFGSAVVLRGKITGPMTQCSGYQFTDGSGAIAANFGILGIPVVNKQIEMNGTVMRGLDRAGVTVSDWRYLATAS
jgi:hypothetical protein